MCSIFKQSWNIVKPLVHSILKQNISVFSTLNMASNTNDTTPDIRSVKPQPFEYFLVLDFEATCDDGVQMTPQVIILIIDKQSVHVLRFIKHTTNSFCCQFGVVFLLQSHEPYIKPEKMV